MKAYIKNTGILLIVAGIILIALDHFIPLEQVLQLLATANHSFILLALGLFIVARLATVFVYKQLLSIFGHDVPTVGMLMTTFKAQFVTNTLPSFGISGLAVVDYYFRQKQIDPATSKRVIVLKNVASGISLLVILLIGFSMLVAATDVMRHLLLPASLTLLIVLVTIYLGYTATAKKRFQRFLYRIRSLFDRIMRPTGSRIEGFAREISDSMRYAAQNKRKLIVPVIGDLISTLILSITVYTLFLAINTNISLGAVITGFITATWVGAASMLPGGIGAFEATMTASYTGVGISLNQVAATILLFRVLSFWMPTALGGLLIQKELGDIRSHIKELVT